jgi:DNA invertase Pin-like site-specific DNA recombinase
MGKNSHILRDRVKAGSLSTPRGKTTWTAASVQRYAGKVRALHKAGVSKSEIARRLSISRTSVRRFLEP